MRTIETMDLVFQTELQRIKIPDSFQDDLNLRNLGQHVEKFDYIFE